MAAAADAAAAVLGLGDEVDEENEEALAAGGDPDDPAGWEEVSELDEDDPSLDEEAIEELKAEFRDSLERVFGYTELSASVVQDKFGLNEPVDLLQTWDSVGALESACNNLIRGANNYAVDNEVPVFRFLMSQDLILYQEWVRLRMSRGLSPEAETLTRRQRMFMNNWQQALKDIKESIRLSAKSESDVLKFNSKDWLRWFKSIDNYFRRTLSVRGVMLDWVYRSEAHPKHGVRYPSIAHKIKATLLLRDRELDSWYNVLHVRQEVREVEERTAGFARFEVPVRRGGLQLDSIGRYE
jgi:hypothetical protein